MKIRIDSVTKKDMKINNNSIELIKQSIRLSDVISNYIKVTKSGVRYKALCPFHSEKSPSFYIDDNKGLFHCFGCKASGDMITFVEKIENISFTDALIRISKIFNIPINYDNTDNLVSGNDKNSIEKAYALMCDYYHQQLLKNKTALDYLYKRKISTDTIKEFKLGFSSQVDKEFILKNMVKSIEQKPEFFESISLIRKYNNDYLPFFYNRLIIPIYNNFDEVIAFGARVFDNSLPKYLNSAEHPLFKKRKSLFNYNNAKKYDGNDIIVVEGYFDAISLYQYGIKNVVAPLGTALTEEHLRLLSKRFEILYLLFDSDTAGQKATITSLELGYKYFHTIYVISLPSEFKDIDEYLFKQERIVQSDTVEKDYSGFKEIMKNAQNGIDILLKSKLYLHKEDRNLKKIYNELLLFISSLSDEVLAETFIRKTAVMDSILSYDDVKTMYANVLKGKNSINIYRSEDNSRISAIKENQQKKSKENTVELSFIIFLACYPEFILQTQQYFKPNDMEDQNAKELYKKILIAQSYDNFERFISSEFPEDVKQCVHEIKFNETYDENKQLVYEDYITYFKLKKYEKLLKELNMQIYDTENKGKFPHELLEKKQYLTNTIQKLKEYRMIIQKK